MVRGSLFSVRLRRAATAARQSSCEFHFAAEALPAGPEQSSAPMPNEIETSARWWQAPAPLPSTQNSGRCNVAGRRRTENTLRQKCVRIAEKTRIPVRYPLRKDDCGSGGQLVSADRAGCDGGPRQNVSRGVQTQNLIHHTTQVWQLPQVRDGWRAPRENVPKLFIKSRFGGWVLAEQIPSPRKRQCRGFVTGRK